MPDNARFCARGLRAGGLLRRLRATPSRPAAALGAAWRGEEGQRGEEDERSTCREGQALDLETHGR